MLSPQDLPVTGDVKIGCDKTIVVAQLPVTSNTIVFLPNEDKKSPRSVNEYKPPFPRFAKNFKHGSIR